MGRRLNQYLGSFGDDGRPKVVFVFDDEEVPEGAECVYRLNRRGGPATDMTVLLHSLPDVADMGG